MKSNAENIVVIDIGSNSVRLFVFEVDDKNCREISSEKFFCGLGRDLGKTGLLNTDAVKMAQAQLQAFRKKISGMEIARELVIGTAALREAKDAAAFCQSVKDQSGFDIRVIEGEEEARLAALAILLGAPEAEGIVADFGGGSLELAKIANGEIEKKLSLKLGAHYLKEMKDRDKGIDQELSAVLERHPEFINLPTLYVIGGSWRSLAKAWLANNASAEIPLEEFSFTGKELIDFCLKVGQMEPGDLVERYQMEVPRAQLMDVSSLMLSHLIRHLMPASVRVSTAGIRDGLAYDYRLNRTKSGT